MSEPPIIVTCRYSSTEVNVDAVMVYTQNFYEGMFDSYERYGNLLRQIDIGSGIAREEIPAAED